jgi:hypothetical protein
VALGRWQPHSTPDMTGSSERQLHFLFSADCRGTRAPIVASALPTYLTATALALAALAGCGGNDGAPSEPEGPKPVSSPAAERLVAWRDAATSYNTILQNCVRQPHPVQGFVAACTRTYRKRYKRAASRVVQALNERRTPTKMCEGALEQSRSLVSEVARVLGDAFRANSELLDASVERPYRGPAVFSVTTRADRVTKRETERVGKLSTAIRRHCAA